MNGLGNIFKVTTFGESHGPYIGVVIDGCPSNILILEAEINQDLTRRMLDNDFTTKRKEIDKVQILSGIYENITTGAPICVIVKNKDIDSSAYDEIKDVLRPSHANFTYLQKYKVFDHRGSSRASARETVARVIAGAFAKKILSHYKIEVFAYVKQIGSIAVQDIDLKRIYKSKIYCPDKTREKEMLNLLSQIKQEGDSIGGVVEFIIKGSPMGLGEPIYNKLDAYLSYALMSLPAVKGFEMGDGFESVKKRGSTRNDLFRYENNNFYTKTNNEGGVLAGISNGMDVNGRIAFKPISTIDKEQTTVDIKGNTKKYKINRTSRHDMCAAIRAVPIVEAMCSIVISDLILLNRSAML